MSAADIPCRMGRSGRDEQGLASLERDRRLALEVILQRPFEDIGDLFARMRVHAEAAPRGEVDPHLDDLASGLAKIVPQDLGASDA